MVALGINFGLKPDGPKMAQSRCRSYRAQPLLVQNLAAAKIGIVSVYGLQVCLSR